MACFSWFLHLLDGHGHFKITMSIVYCNVIGNYFAVNHEIFCMFLFPRNFCSLAPLNLPFGLILIIWSTYLLVWVLPSTLGLSSFNIGRYWILKPYRRLISRVITPISLIILIVTPTGHPIGLPKNGYTLWYDINIHYFKNIYRTFLHPNH